MGQKRELRRLRINGSRTLERLEAREMLDGDGFELTPDASVHELRVGIYDFASEINWQKSVVNAALFNSGPEITFTPAIVGGSANGPNTPVDDDSPTNAIDSNTPAGGAFGGVASIKILIPNYPNPNSSTPPLITAEFLCTGSVVSPTYVLTAAHCFDELDANGLVGSDGVLDPGLTATVQLNDGDAAGNGTFSSTHTVATFELHNSFSGFSLGTNDDVALLQLSTPVPAGTPMYSVADSILDQSARINMVGYGIAGYGDTIDPDNGVFVTPNPEVKRERQNIADVFVADDEKIPIEFPPGSGQFIPGFMPVGPDEIFIFDFDGPTGDGWMGLGGTLGNDVEGNIAPGDSGGPSFMMDNAGNLLLDGNGLPIIGGVNTFNGIFGFGGKLGFVDVSPTTSGLGGGMMMGAYADWMHGIIGVDLDLSTNVTVTPNNTPGMTLVSYELTVTNNGPNDATGVNIAETLFDVPATATITSTASAGTFTSPTWDIGSLAALGSETLTIDIEFDPNTVNLGDPIDISFAVDAVVEPDTDDTNDSVTDSINIPPPPPVAMGAEVFGSGWAIDAAPLNIGANSTLPYGNLDRFSITYSTPLAAAPPVDVYGPSDGDPLIPATLVSFDVPTATAVYSVSALSKGYYKLYTAGSEIDFSVMPGDANATKSTDIFDFGAFAGNYNPGFYYGTTPVAGDFDGTGTVDIFDFGVFASNYLGDISTFIPPQLPPPPPPPPAPPQNYAAFAAADAVWASIVEADSDDEDDERSQTARQRFV